MKLFIINLCVCLSVLFSCRQKSEVFQSVTVDEFETLLSDPSVQCLDVRTVAEYTEGHIPGCLNINVLDENSFLEMANTMLRKEQPVALYCRSGKRSKKAAQLLGKQGYKVYEMKDGFNGWKGAGKKVQ